MVHLGNISLVSILIFALTSIPLLAASQDKDESGSRALIVIDVQKVYFEGELKVTHPSGSLENIIKVMKAAKAHNIPVVIIQHTSMNPESSFRPGNPLWDIHPQITSIKPDVTFEKNYPGSFTKTGLDQWLKRKGITTVTIAGYMTQMCCDTTARQAAHRDYKVEFLSDATGTLDFNNGGGKVTAEELHRAILVAQASGLSSVMTSDDWLNQIDEDQ